MLTSLVIPFWWFLEAQRILSNSTPAKYKTPSLGQSRNLKQNFFFWVLELIRILINITATFQKIFFFEFNASLVHYNTQWINY